MTSMNKVLAAVALTLGLTGATLAGTLASLSPFALESSGQQSDASTGAYTQAFAAPADTIVEEIRWFGFHTADSGGASFDNFVVTLGGVLQTGVLTHSAVLDAGGLYTYDAYALDIADVALTASSLSISNQSDDVAWYWQSAVAVGNPGAASADLVAFELIGRTGTSPTVPEPSSVLLVSLGLAALALDRRRGRTPAPVAG